MSDQPDRPTDPRSDVTFTVRAQATPDVLPRVLDLFARRNLVPERWVSLRTGPGRAHLVFEIEIAAMAESVAERIAASMRQIVNVDSVVTSPGPARSGHLKAQATGELAASAVPL